jgi:hypothetical protein
MQVTNKGVPVLEDIPYVLVCFGSEGVFLEGVHCCSGFMVPIFGVIHPSA